MLTWHRVSLLLCCVLLAHVVALPSDMPIALHQLVSVDTASDAVIRLKGWDAKTPKVSGIFMSQYAHSVLNRSFYVCINCVVDIYDIFITCFWNAVSVVTYIFKLW